MSQMKKSPPSKALKGRQTTAQGKEPYDPVLGSPARPTFPAPTGRQKKAQGKEHRDAALGSPPPQNPSPEGATQMPVGWLVLPLSQMGTWRGGGTPSKSNPAFWTNGSIPWVSPKDMKRPKLSTAQDLITEAAVKASATSLIDAGSVLMVTRSGILSHSLPVAVNLVPVALNQDIKAITPSPATEGLYLWFAFKCFERDILNACRKGGTTVHSIEFPSLLDFVIPLPPLAEQKRIVSKIEELFSELDAGEESLRRARRQLGVYRQSLLKQAFEGKLTAPWRKQNPHLLESSDQLVKRIQAERQARYEQKLNHWQTDYDAWENGGTGDKRPAKPRKPKGIHLPTANQVTHLPDLPPEWSWIAVENCAVEISDGPFGSNLKSSDYVGFGVRVVRLENIGAGEFIEDKESFISHEKYEILKRHTVRPGDIVVASFINDAVRAALVPPSIPYAVNKADCFQVHCFGESLSAQFLLKCLGSRYFFKQLEQLVHGVGRPRINTTQLGESFVPLCSLPEQQEIIRLLDEQFTVIEQNEREIDAALKRSAALRQSILKKAFTGQLVPQDPTDEPASALLERIRKERVSAVESKKMTIRNSASAIKK